MRKLSTWQRLALKNIAGGRAWDYGFPGGASFLGGTTQTVPSLCRRKLVYYERDLTLRLTELGMLVVDGLKNA